MNRYQMFGLYSVIMATGAMVVKGKYDEMILLACVGALLSVYYKNKN